MFVSDASFRKKAYDLEKMQKTITLLKQSAEFENLLKKYLDSNFAAMKKAKRLAVICVTEYLLPLQVLAT